VVVASCPFRWPDQRLVVEADSRSRHDNLLAREDDAERRRCSRHTASAWCGLRGSKQLPKPDRPFRGSGMLAHRPPRPAAERVRKNSAR
jgi:hypothetical protein